MSQYIHGLPNVRQQQLVDAFSGMGSALAQGAIKGYKDQQENQNKLQMLQQLRNMYDERTGVAAANNTQRQYKDNQSLWDINNQFSQSLAPKNNGIGAALFGNNKGLQLNVATPGTAAWNNASAIANQQNAWDNNENAIKAQQSAWERANAANNAAAMNEAHAAAERLRQGQVLASNTANAYRQGLLPGLLPNNGVQNIQNDVNSRLAADAVQQMQAANNANNAIRGNVAAMLGINPNYDNDVQYLMNNGYSRDSAENYLKAQGVNKPTVNMSMGQVGDYINAGGLQQYARDNYKAETGNEAYNEFEQILNLMDNHNISYDMAAAVIGADKKQMQQDAAARQAVANKEKIAKFGKKISQGASKNELMAEAVNLGMPMKDIVALIGAVDKNEKLYVINGSLVNDRGQVLASIPKQANVSYSHSYSNRSGSGRSSGGLSALLGDDVNSGGGNVASGETNSWQNVSTDEYDPNDPYTLNVGGQFFRAR